jgi:peptidoglycan/LPS O-acetylase OafA/YrhL
LTERVGTEVRPTREAIPPAVAPPPGNPRFPLVDGVRAIAAISVLFFHAGIGSSVPLVYAYQFASGVPIFFLVSGFLLYRPFVAGRLRSSGRKIRIRDFARRRLLRIVPAYWVALTLLAIYPTLSGGVFGSRAPIYYGFAQDYFRARSSEDSASRGASAPRCRSTCCCRSRRCCSRV